MERHPIHIQKLGNRRHDDTSLEGNRQDWRNMHPYDRLRAGISADPITAYIGFRAVQEQMLSDEAEPRAWAEHKRRYPEQFGETAQTAGTSALHARSAAPVSAEVDFAGLEAAIAAAGEQETAEELRIPELIGGERL